MNLALYERKTAVEHILHAPDMYIGSAQPSEVTNWIMQETITQKNHLYVSGLYKLFDEVLVNANDQYVRMKETTTPVTFIHCTIIDGTITIVNDGPGIDVAIHPKYEVYIPQMVFAELLTSTNYSASKKIVGGKNGIGVKLVLIWSTYAKIETVDSVRKLKYTQVFRNNLSIIESPIITK
jgi:DNA topoisomerase-2